MFNPLKYFTIRSLALHIGVTTIGKMYPKVLPLWLFNSTRSLVSICSIFGTLILYKNVDYFAKIFGSKFRVYLIDFIIHSIPFLYTIIISNKFTKYFRCNQEENQPIFSTTYYKFLVFQVAWFLLYLRYHNPSKVYNIKKVFVGGLFVTALGLISGVWHCMQCLDCSEFLKSG